MNRTIEFERNDILPLLFGEHNAHLAHLEKKLGISIADRGNRLILSGQDQAVAAAEAVLRKMEGRLNKDQEVVLADIDAAIRFIENRKDAATMPETIPTSKPLSSSPSGDQEIVIQTRRKSIVPRTPKQEGYIKTIQKQPMVFGLGPAGTGKTYLAVAVGVSMHLKGEVERLIFCRPAVEAGERLGFLPGDMKEKVDPYLRPIYDALSDMMPWDMVVKKMETGEIEIAPLAFMRGRTLANAFVILDEAQNATSAQMKMFLTRMGESSRMVITGDPSQTDLPYGVKSGLSEAASILRNIPEIGFVTFDKADVIRHPLVGKIVHAYEEIQGQQS